MNRIIRNPTPDNGLSSLFFSSSICPSFFYRYHIVKLSLHEGFDKREDLVHEPDCVQHVNGLESDRHGLLNIFEESPDTVYRQPRQVAETYAVHVEEEYVSRRTAIRVKARVDGHQQQLDAIVEHVLERSSVCQAVKNYPMAVLIRLGKRCKLPAM